MSLDLSPKELRQNFLSKMEFKVELLTTWDNTGEELESFLKEVIEKGLKVMSDENRVIPLESDIRVTFTKSQTAEDLKATL